MSEEHSKISAANNPTTSLGLKCYKCADVFDGSKKIYRCREEDGHPYCSKCKGNLDFVRCPCGQLLYGIRHRDEKLEKKIRKFKTESPNSRPPLKLGTLRQKLPPVPGLPPPSPLV